MSLDADVVRCWSLQRVYDQLAMQYHVVDAIILAAHVNLPLELVFLPAPG